MKETLQQVKITHKDLENGFNLFGSQDNVSITGKAGSGKSLLLKKFAESAASGSEKIWIIDTQGSHFDIAEQSYEMNQFNLNPFAYINDELLTKARVYELSLLMRVMLSDEVKTRDRDAMYTSAIKSSFDKYKSKTTPAIVMDTLKTYITDDQNSERSSETVMDMSINFMKYAGLFSNEVEYFSEITPSNIGHITYETKLNPIRGEMFLLTLMNLKYKSLKDETKYQVMIEDVDMLEASSKGSYLALLKALYANDDKTCSFVTTQTSFDDGFIKESSSFDKVSHHKIDCRGFKENEALIEVYIHSKPIEPYFIDVSSVTRETSLA